MLQLLLGGCHDRMKCLDSDCWSMMWKATLSGDIPPKVPVYTQVERSSTACDMTPKRGLLLILILADI